MKKTSTNPVFAQWVRKLSQAIAFVIFAVCSYAQQRVIGTVKKRDLTGAVTSMKSGDITIAPTGNAMEALQVNFDAFVGINDWSVLPKLSADHYINTINEASQWAGTDPSDSVLSDAMRAAYERGEVIDWADALLHTGVTQNYSLSVSGGTQKTQAYFSVNYSEEQGQYKRDNYKLYSSMMRINHNINKWFSAGVHTQLSYSEKESAYSKLEQAMRANPYSVSAVDKQIIGHASPDWSFGFQNTFVYKNFDLSIYMYGRFGQMMYYDPLMWYSSDGGNFPGYFNYWTPDNPSNDFPSLNASRNWRDDAYSTARGFVDASFFKIKNITLGYTLPDRACRKIGLSRFRVYATVTNPLVVAKSHLVKDYDPEMNGSLDFPLTKQVVFGVNLSF